MAGIWSMLIVKTAVLTWGNMKSKEEILKSHLKENEHHGDKTPDLFTCFLIYDAMDEYAKDVVGRFDRKLYVPPHNSMSDLEQRSKNIELLVSYSEWLEDYFYMDSDWRDELPYAIDSFLNSQNKDNN